MQRFGPYEVVRRIGAGGFGAVYEVRHRETGATYALKALHPLHDPSERLRFQREAEAMGRLDHPHVARVHAAALEGPAPYLVQELLPGGPSSTSSSSPTKTRARSRSTSSSTKAPGMRCTATDWSSAFKAPNEAPPRMRSASASRRAKACSSPPPTSRRSAAGCLRRTKRAR